MSSSSPLSFSKNNPNQHFSFMTDRTNNSSIKNIAARNISSALSLQRSRARNTREDKLSKKRLASKIEDEEIEAIKEHEAYVDFQLEQEEIRQLEEEYEEQQNFEKRLLLTGKSCLAHQENQNKNNKNDPENCGDDDDGNTSDCGAECGGDDDEVDLQLDDGESRLFSHLQQSKYKNNQNNSKINHLHHNNNSNPQQQNDDDDAAQQYYHEQQQEEYDNEYFLEDPEELYQYHLMMQQYNQYQQELQQQQGNTNNNMNSNCSSNSNNYYTEADHQKFRKFREEVETSCAKMTRVHQEDSSCYSEDSTKHVSFCLPSNNSENENHYNNNYYQNNNYYYSSGGGDDDGNFMMSKNTGSKGNGNLRYTDLGYDKNGEKVVAIFKDMTNNNNNSASYVAGNMFCAQD